MFRGEEPPGRSTAWPLEASGDWEFWINAVSGEPWTPNLNGDPQDYVVIPDQPWLDGYCIEKGLVRQFVAMPLGDGYSAEEQITGKADHGGIQILVYPMKAKRYELFFFRQF